MKKTYIKPDSHVVIVSLMGSILETRKLGSSSEIAISMFSREAQEDRFEDTNEDWDWEDNSK